IDPANAPLPTCWDLPFHPATGIQTSVLMSESDEGVSVSCRRQNAGRPLIGRGACAPSGVAGGVNCPAGTTVAAVTLALVNFRAPATRSQAAASADDLCA